MSERYIIKTFLLFEEKPSGQKGQRPAATVSDLAQNIDENLVIENGETSVSKTDDEKSQSAVNQNGQV
jgi:hypothetical protein